MNRLSRCILVCLWLVALPWCALGLDFGRPLINAADAGEAGEVEKRIKAGQDVNQPGEFGVTALMRAALKGDERMVALLLAAGADVAASDIGGETALHLAARKGNSPVVAQLIKAHAPVDAMDKQGWTPLMRAVTTGNISIAAACVAAGADSSRRNSASESPLTVAEKSGNSAMLAVLTPTLALRVAEKAPSEAEPAEAIKKPPLSITMREGTSAGGSYETITASVLKKFTAPKQTTTPVAVASLPPIAPAPVSAAPTPTVAREFIPVRSPEISAPVPSAASAKDTKKETDKQGGSSAPVVPVPVLKPGTKKMLLAQQPPPPPAVARPSSPGMAYPAAWVPASVAASASQPPIAPLPGAPSAQTRATTVYVLQLGVFSSKETAASAWYRLQGKYETLLKDIIPVIKKELRIEPKGLTSTAFLLRAGQFTQRQEADRLCGMLNRQREACFVVNKTNEPKAAIVAPKVQLATLQPPVPMVSPAPTPSPPVVAPPAISAAPKQAPVVQVKTPQPIAPMTQSAPLQQTPLPIIPATVPAPAVEVTLPTPTTLPPPAVITPPVQTAELAPKPETKIPVKEAPEPPLPVLLPATPVAVDNTLPWLQPKQVALETPLPTPAKAPLLHRTQDVLEPASYPTTTLEKTLPPLPATAAVQAAAVPLPTRPVENRDTLSQIPLNDFAEEYQNFDQELAQKGLSHRASVSEAVMVQNDTSVFDGQPKLVHQTPIAPAGGTAVTLSGFKNKQMADDYYDRMFRFNDDLKQAKMDVVPQKNLLSSGVSVVVSPIPPSFVSTVCDIAKANDLGCVPSGSASQAAYPIRGQRRPVNQDITPPERVSAAKGTWIQLGTFATQSEAEYYWMLLQEDHQDVLSALQHKLSPVSHGAFGGNAVGLKAGPFAENNTASQLCKRLTAQHVSCAIAE